MSERIEAAKIELEIAEDLETVNAAEIMRWLQSRSMSSDAVKRAAAAIGRAKRLRLSLQIKVGSSAK